MFRFRISLFEVRLVGSKRSLAGSYVLMNAVFRPIPSAGSKNQRKLDVLQSLL